MITIKPLNSYDELLRYKDDIQKCIEDNPQIRDEESRIVEWKHVNEYIDSLDSSVLGIFDKDCLFLFGLIIYDNIRLTNDGNSAEVHICMSRDFWGKEFTSIYNKILREGIFDVIYAQIPSKCRPTLSLCKRLGFKKTGYIPKVVPYKNVKGEVKMYDILIYTWVKRDAKI